MRENQPEGSERTGHAPGDSPSAPLRAPLPPLSLLELALVEEGTTAHDGLAAVLATARRASELGFRRVWTAEHHRYRPVASGTPPVLAAHLAANTEKIRLGSGGVLLPHHAPLVVAEQFTTLAALHPDRIDLGIARGPGTTDPNTIRALRRGADQATDAEYRDDIVELLGHLADVENGRVIPGAEASPQPWLLSSSVAGAELAAEFGLPLAFAHHIRPGNAPDALARYRDLFRPSRWQEEPYVLVSVETLCAPTESEARYLARPSQLAMAPVLEGRGSEAVLLPPAKAAAETISPALEEKLEQMRATQAHGTPQVVRGKLSAIAAQTGADEIMLRTPVYDLHDRMRSLSLIAAGG